MGPGFISSTVVVVAKIALAATVRTTTDIAYPVTEFTDLVFATSNPIRTVVTVNSNRVDVLAADEKDVPKVLEKLRELCAGPFASLYPEICEHFETGGTGEDLDLDGLDPIVWWPPEDPTPHLITTASTGTGGYPSGVHPTRTSSASLPEETSSNASSNILSSDLSQYTPDTSSPLLVTLTVPAETKTTKTFEVVVHEVPETGVSAPEPTTIQNNKGPSEDPTTFETKIRSSSASLENASDNTVTAAGPKDEFQNITTATDTLDGLEKPPPTPTSPTVPAEPEEASSVTESTEVQSGEPTSRVVADEVDSSAPPTATPEESEEPPITSTDKPAEPETSLECPWRTDEDEDGPGPCTVVTIYQTSVIRIGGGPTSTSSSSRHSKFRPVFEPTASPRPSRSRTSFDVTLIDPPTTTTDTSDDESTATPIWFTAFHGCTQTVKLLKKMGNPWTATVYPSTVTSTAFISCSCPNLATEYIGAHGLVILPRTTTTVLEPKTEKVLSCSPSTYTATQTGY